MVAHSLTVQIDIATDLDAAPSSHPAAGGEHGCSLSVMARLRRSVELSDPTELRPKPAGGVHAYEKDYLRANRPAALSRPTLIGRPAGRAPGGAAESPLGP